MKYHPDKNPGDEDASVFYRKINRAYEVLSDDEKRQAYDQGGEEGVERFEGGHGQMRRGPSFRVEMDIHLEDMYHGRERSITITRNIYCNKCKGSGAKDGKLKTCP